MTATFHLAQQRIRAARLLQACLLTLLALAPGLCPAPAAAAPRVRESIRNEIFFSDLEAKGQYDELLKRWLADIVADPDSAESYLMLSRIDDIQDYCNDFYGIVRNFLAEFNLNDCRNGHTQYFIRSMQFDLLARDGHWNRARELMLRSGSLRSWMLCGPFGFDGESDHAFDTAYPPETEVDFKAAYPKFPGSDVEARWLPAYMDVTDNGLSPDSIITDGGCVYAYCQFKVDEARDCLLQVLAASSYKLWLNGELIHVSDARLGDQRFDQWLRVKFDIGWNGLLLKLPAAQFFHVALLDPRGRPLPGIAEEEEVMRWNIKDRAAAKVELMKNWPESQLVEELAQSPDSAFLHEALSYLYRYESDDDCLRHAEAAASLASDRAAAQFQLHEALEIVSHLPEAVTLTRRKSALDAALALDPDFVPGLLSQASYFEENDQPKQVFQALQRVEGIAPEFAYAHLRQSKYAFDKRWLHETRKHLEIAEQLAPDNTDIYRFHANYYGAMQNHEKELELWFKIREWDRSADVEESIAQVLTSMGRFDEAIGQYASLLEIHPRSRDYQMRLADLYRRNSNVTKTLRTYKRLLDDAPNDLNLARQIADLEYRHATDDEDALSLYSRVLAENPSDETLRRFLQYRSGQEEDFATPYRHNAEQMVAAAPDASAYPDANALCVLNQRVMRFNEDYSYAVIDHAIYKVLTQGGQDMLGRLGQRGELLEVRTITKDGRSLEPLVMRGTALVMPGLEIGACVETRFRNASGAPGEMGFNAQPFFFQDARFQMPMGLSELVLILPKTLDLDQQVRNADITPEVTETETERVYIYRMTNQAKLVPEPAMPSPDKTLPNVQLKRKTNWDQLKMTYGPTSYPFEYPTQLLRDTAAKAVEGIDGAHAKAVALYEFVNREITDEQGAYNAHATLIGKSGIRDYLFAALGKTVGLDMVTGFARQNEAFLDPIQEGYRNVSDYGTELLGVRLESGEIEWLTFASRYQAYGSLPAAFYGGSILLPAYTTGGEPKIVPLPEGTVEATTVQNRVTLTLQADGSATGTFEMVIPGVEGAQFKENISQATQEQRVQFIAQQLNGIIRGASATGGGFTDVDGYGTPLQAKLNFKVRDLTTSRKADGAEVPLGLSSLGLQQLTDRKYRKFDLDLRFHYRAHNTTEYTLSEGVTAESLPQNVDLSLGGLSYRLTCAQDGNTIKIDRDFVLTPCRIDSKEYPKMLDFSRETDIADQGKIRLSFAPKEEPKQDPAEEPVEEPKDE